MKIVDFFFETAERKGIRLKSVVPRPPKDAYFEEVSDGGTNYKLQYMWENSDGSYQHYFTIYGNGSWVYEGPVQTLEGKLPPPHSKSWIKRLIKRGVPPDFAKCDWGEYYALRHEK